MLSEPKAPGTRATPGWSHWNWPPPIGPQAHGGIGAKGDEAGTLVGYASATVSGPTKLSVTLLNTRMLKVQTPSGLQTSERGSLVMRRSAFFSTGGSHLGSPRRQIGIDAQALSSAVEPKTSGKPLAV